MTGVRVQLLPLDPQLYLKCIAHDGFVIISTYVDDIFFISRQTGHIQDALDTLRKT